VDDRVQRLATVHLAGVTLERLMAAVANGYGLTATVQGGAWTISDGLPSSMAPYIVGEMRVLQLDYLDAAAAIDLLPNFLIRYVRPSTSGDAVIAQGPPQLLNRIEQDLRVLDRPVRMVKVRTAVVEASDTVASERLWRLLRGGRTRVRFDPGAGSIGIERGDRSLERYVAAIRALRARGRVTVTVQPEMIVYPGSRGLIFVGERQYYQFVQQTWWGEENVTLESADAGVRLDCRPRPTGSGLIESRIQVEVSTLRRVTGGPPVIDTRSAFGTLLVRGGDTMVIGGGLVLSQGEAQRQAPWPPGQSGPLGRAAEARSDEQQMREIVFLMSSEVVEGKLPAEAAMPPAPTEG